MTQAVAIVAKNPVTVAAEPSNPLPSLLLKPIRTALLSALVLSSIAESTHEQAEANHLFLKALAQSHVLCYRASFHVVVDHVGRKSVDVAFCYDTTLENW